MSEGIGQRGVDVSADKMKGTRNTGQQAGGRGCGSSCCKSVGQWAHQIGQESTALLPRTHQSVSLSKQWQRRGIERVIGLIGREDEKKQSGKWEAWSDR